LQGVLYQTDFWILYNNKKMKSLNLDTLGLQELEESEMRNLQGGMWPALALALLLSAVENFQDIRQGFSDGLRRARSRYDW